MKINDLPPAKRGLRAFGRRLRPAVDRAVRRGPGRLRATIASGGRKLRLMDVLQCLKKYGQRLDSEIAEETGIALATVRERLAGLTGTGEVISCKLTRFENGKPIDACLYRASGYFPPPAPGRKAKPPA
jgi:hypothetical protein